MVAYLGEGLKVSYQIIHLWFDIVSCKNSYIFYKIGVGIWAEIVCGWEVNGDIFRVEAERSVDRVAFTRRPQTPDGYNHLLENIQLQ